MRKKRIMLVDDDADLLPLFEYAAAIEDMIILVMQGGFSALKSLESFNYDIDAVILDLSMPDIDGINLTKYIRNNENIRSKAHPIKIFWYTGWPINDTLENAKAKYSVSDIFTKPAQPSEIISQVKERIN